MSSLADLKPAVERKSGQRLISSGVEDLRPRLGFKVVSSMRKNGFHPSITDALQAFNAQLEAVLGNPDGAEYLCALTTTNNYTASGIRVLSLDAIKEQLHELEPGAILFRHGYLPIACSADECIVCFHWSANEVVWTDHTVFCEDCFSFKNQITNWEKLPFTKENTSKIFIRLAKDLKCFLSDMLDDKFAEQFAKLN